MTLFIHTKLRGILHHKSTYCILITKHSYVEVLNKGREAKNKQRGKILRDYQILKFYDTVNVGHCDKLYYPFMEDSSTFLTIS